MNHILSLQLVIGLVLGLWSARCWAQDTSRTPENPLKIEIQIHPRRLILDESGTPVVWSGGPKNTHPHIPVAAFDVVDIASAASQADQGKQALPFGVDQGKLFLQAFHVSALNDAGTQWTEPQLKRVWFSASMRGLV